MMKNSLRLVFCLLIATVFSQAAYSETTKNLKIAIIDRGKIEKESVAFQKLLGQAESSWGEYLEKIRKKETAFREKEQELKSNSKKLTPKKLEVAKTKHITAVEEFQKEASSQKMKIDNMLQNGRKVVYNSLSKIIGEIVNDQSIDIVLWKAQTIHFDKSLDITDLVIKKLNSDLPTIK